MAYRFLLSVPTPLVDDANIAVAQADDAQVLLVRNAHDLGFEEPYADLTVAAHSLRVVATIYDWWESLAPSPASVGLVLHGGDRLSLAERDRGAMVAAIRRDQPWVERTLPRIGQHARDESLAPARAAGAVPAAQGATMTSTTTATATMSDTASTASSVMAGLASAGGAPQERTWETLPAEERAQRRVGIRAVNHVAVRVIDLERAERFYGAFLGMDVVARGVRNLGGETLDLIGPGYVWSEAGATGREADVSFLRNGPLVVALYRLGRGARIERDVLDHISLRVEPGAFRQLKGEALMRSMEILSSTDRSVAIRDPFGITWEISVDALPELLA